MIELSKPKLRLVPKVIESAFVTALVIPSDTLRDDAIMSDGALQATFLSLAFANAFPERHEQALLFNQGGMFTADAISMRSPWVTNISDYVILLRKSTAELEANVHGTPIDLTTYSVIFVGKDQADAEARVQSYSHSHGVIIPKELTVFVGEHNGTDFYLIISDMPMPLVTTCEQLVTQFNYETRLENIKVVK